MAEEIVEDMPLDDEEFRARRMARISTRLGIAAMGLAIFSTCTYGVTGILALLFAGFGTYCALHGYRNSEEYTATRAYAKVGLITNITAGVCCILFTALFAMYFAFCGLIILAS